MISAFAQTNVTINEVGGASQFQFDGHKTWVYQLNEKKDHVELLLPILDPKAAKKISSYKSSVLSKLVVEKDTETRSRIKFYVKKDIDSFDYQMEDPSRLIIDFFLDEKKKQARLKKEKAAKRNIASELSPKVEKVKTPEELEAERKAKEKAAMDKLMAELSQNNQGTFDGGDPNFERFTIADYEIKESAIIASRKNIYIQYPFLIQKNKILDKVLEKPPIYEVKFHDKEETKQVLLLKKLFDKKRHSVFITTLKFFRDKYPNSKYDQIVRYLEADTYYSLWKRDNEGVDLQKALALYQSLLSDYPKSPLAERTRLLIAYSYLNIGDNFGALKSFIQMINTDPKTPYKNDLRISIGDAYRDLAKFDDALDTYRVIYLDDKAGDKRIEAKYKMGDVYARKKDYKRSIASYKDAIKEFPEHAKYFPNAFYNIAESQFWLGEYRKSLDSYIAYVRNYPKSEHGGFALTRIGEILEILGADEAKFKGAYLESWFRFRSTQGADIARIRFISQMMPKMKAKAVEAAHREVESYVNKSELPFMKDFTTIILSDGYYKRGELDKALFLLEDFYKNNSTATTLDLFRDRIVKSLTRQVEQKVEQKKFVEAIQFYGKYAGTWLRDSERVDLRFALGKSFEEAGVLKEADKIYRATVNRLYALEGTEELKEKKIFENLPNIAQLNLRLANVNEKLGNLDEARKYISRSMEDLTALNQNLQVEAVLVKSNIDENQGRYADAVDGIKKLLQSWKGKPELIQKPLFRMAKLFEKSGQNVQALNPLSKVLNLYKDTGLVEDKLLRDTREMMAKIYLSQGKEKEAGQIFEQLIAAAKKDQPLNDVRYKLGEIYFSQGQMKKAKDIWTDLQNRANGESWYQLAKEKMDSKEWNEQYEKYLNRLPASQQ